MEDLQMLSKDAIFKLIKCSDEKFAKFLATLGLIYDRDTKRPCTAEGCNGFMTFRENKGKQFRCTIKSCRKHSGFNCKTFFEGSHLTFKEVRILIYLLSKCEVEMTKEKLLKD